MIDSPYEIGGDLVADLGNSSVYWTCGKYGDTISHDPVLINYVMGVSKTTDEGLTWARYVPSHDTGYAYALCVDPTDQNTVYVGGYTDQGGIARARLYKTTNSGETWSDMSSGLHDTVFAITIYPENTEILYVGTDDGVFKSVDGGMNWINKGLSDVRSIIINPDAPNIINAGTNTGVYVSFSGGVEWQLMNDGLDNTDIRWLGLDQNDYLFAGTWGRSIYRCVPEYDDIWPPIAPSLTKVEKSGDDAVLTWRAIKTDTLENPDSIDHYVIYRSTSPSFVPGSTDSIGSVYYPDTTFTDLGVVAGTQDYYYILKAIDKVANRSKNSNIGYIFHKLVNENALTTDRNWVSLPWHNNYAVVSALTTDLSPAGEPLVKVTNLRDDQKYESWLWDPDFGEWYGEDFVIEHGQGYEMVTVRDTTVVLVGCNDPDGVVSLNENPATTDRNWVSVPYNHAYSTVSAITTEYSPAGNPLVKLTNLRDDNKYESWLWDPDFGEWYGTDFVIERGQGYEMVTVVDTVWDPTEYSNESGVLFVKQRRQTDMCVRLGTALTLERTPVWIEDKKVNAAQRAKSRVQSAGSVSHIVRLHVDVKDFESPVFTVYRPDKPVDVLTETMIGCGIAEKAGSASFWFDVGNFKESWVNEEEVLLIVEATKQGRGYCAVVSFVLDNTVDIQDLGCISLVPISEMRMNDKNIIGYSLYKNDTRLNAHVLATESYPLHNDVVIRPVMRGGYETVYGSQGVYSIPYTQAPTSYEFSISPNLSAPQLHIEYALPQETFVKLTVYDASGRKVRSLITGAQKAGLYSLTWNGTDESRRRIAHGVYFIKFEAGEYSKVQKAIIVQ